LVYPGNCVPSRQPVVVAMLETDREMKKITKLPSCLSAYQKNKALILPASRNGSK